MAVVIDGQYWREKWGRDYFGVDMNPDSFFPPDSRAPIAACIGQPCYLPADRVSQRSNDQPTP